MLEGSLVTFEDVRMSVLGYFCDHEGWVEESDLKSYISTLFRHERLFFWVHVALTSLENKSLIESSGEQYRKVWKLRNNCAKIEAEE